MQLQVPLSDIKGVGPKLSLLFDRCGLTTVYDLLMYFPRRYDDYSKISYINQIKPGKVSIKGQISNIKSRYVRFGLHITEAIASDNKGSVRVVWFNQPYKKNMIQVGQEYYLAGTYELRNSRYQIVNPALELTSQFPVNTGRIVPIYKETKGLTSQKIRQILKQIISSEIIIKEVLPSNIRSKYKLIGRHKALITKHFPKTIDDLNKADYRLGFEELFELILSSQVTKQEVGLIKAPRQPIDENFVKLFATKLPFKLTDAQRKTIWRILKDMNREKPMNRMIEGDVGSGKTVVAAMAAANVLNNGYSVAFLAPTELLARQHCDTLTRLLKPVSLSDSVFLLTGKMKKSQKSQVIEQAKNKVGVLIGTHALLEETVSITNLGLVIIDEQHRFGVDQRKKMIKKGIAPHMLTMTATPIPRSLALTIFGELDISVLDQKPKNRLLIKTKLVKPVEQVALYKNIKDKLLSGAQMFVVCPLIEQSDLLPIKSAQSVYNQLTKIFPNIKVGLLHGKKSSIYKQKIMQDFVDGKIKILVSTTVIEVGVDVPNANIMMIEAPERFGLAQLHQLRGRVGRSQKQGYCYLILSDNKEPSRRLKIIESTNDGFKLAQLDLEIRGAGTLYGRAQHGLLDLRVADFTDAKLIAKAREAALDFLKDNPSMIQYPYIKQRILELQAAVHLN